MSLKNIKLNQERGFTIVELLIVVVVIAILAAITIVSYNGITNRANTSNAASMATNAAKKAELYNTDDSTNGYPATIAALGTDTSKAYALSGVTGTLAAPTASNGKTTVQYVPCGVAASGTTAPTTQSGIGTITGVVVNYWDFANSRATSVTAASFGAAATTATSPAGVTTGQITGTSGGKTIGCPLS